MRKLIIIGLLSVFSTCNKSATVQLSNVRSYTLSGHKIVATHWFLAGGPGSVTFDHPDSSVVNVVGTKLGNYIIGNWVKDDRGMIDTGFSYINAQ